MEGGVGGRDKILIGERKERTEKKGKIKMTEGIKSKKRRKKEEIKIEEQKKKKEKI